MFGDDEKRILKHCVTRWLSLGKCLTRVLEQWRSLLLFFKEECSDNKVSFQPRLAAYTIPKQKVSSSTFGKKNKKISYTSSNQVKSTSVASQIKNKKVPNISPKRVKSTSVASPAPKKKIKIDVMCSTHLCGTITAYFKFSKTSKKKNIR